MKKIAVLLFVLVFTAGSAFAAAEWNLYGSARLQSWWVMEDAPDAGPTGFANGERDRDNLVFDLQNNSRLGATVKFNDAVSGQFEFGINPDGGNVTNRVIIGHWNFGAGTLSVGQGYTPIYIPISSQAYATDQGMLYTAEPYSSRRPMIQLAFGKFKFALIKQHAQNLLGQAGELKTTIPKIEAAFGQKIGPFSFDVVGGYQTYEIDTPATDFDVDSFVVGARAIYSTGPFRLGVVGRYAQNGAQFGLTYSNNALTGDFGGAQVALNDVLDNDSWGAGAIVGFQASKKLNFELGYAHAESENDEVAGVSQPTRKVDNYYLQAAVTLAPGVFIIPAVGMFERSDDTLVGVASQDGKKVTYAGAKWQINF